MKKVGYVWFAGMVFSGVLTGLAVGQSSSTTAQNTNTVVSGTSSVTSEQNTQEPSLGSYARSLRKDKPKAGKTFDNDNLPKNDKISVVGDDISEAAKPAASDDASQTPTAATSNSEKPKVMPGQTQEQRQQVYDKWQEKLSTQQSQIDSMAHELDLNQREYRLRAASYYADAGNRLRNEADWDKQDAEYKQKIADQQKALDDAKAKLNDMQEDARKAGVPEQAQQPAEGSEAEQQ